MAERDDSREVSGALAALLELEGDVSERIARARETSERAVSEAHTAAERASARRPEELGEALTELRTTLETAHRAELAAIDEGAQSEADRYDAVDDDTIASLADALVEELVSLIASVEGSR